MLYSLFFYNATTEVVMCKQQYGRTAQAAIQNFRRWVRKYDELKSGDSYRILMYEADKRDINGPIPEQLFNGKMEIAK